MALGVKGKWKKRKDGRKDHRGQPEMAHIKGSYNASH
jgi:hypothetical protein